MKIGVSSYSFSQYIHAGKMTQFDTVAKAKELGFEAIEFTDLTPPEGVSESDFAKKIKDEADKTGIEISASVICANLAQPTEEKLQAEIKRLKNKLDIAAILGAKFFRHDVMYMYDDFPSFGAALPTIAKGVRAVTEYAETLGIKTMTENHGHICQDPDRLEQLTDAVAHPNFGILADMGNFLCADVTPELAVSRLANRVFFVHAKDFKVIDFYEKSSEGFTTRAQNRLVGMPVGKGAVKVEQCLAILKQAGFDGNIDIEFEGADDCIKSLKFGLNYLKNLI